jgi:hypothetical protein
MGVGVVVGDIAGGLEGVNLKVEGEGLPMGANDGIVVEVAMHGVETGAGRQRGGREERTEEDGDHRLVVGHLRDGRARGEMRTSAWVAAHGPGAGHTVGVISRHGPT